MAETLSNNATGTLAGNMLIGATSCTLTGGQGAAFPSTGNFRILIGSELILVGARSIDTLSSLTRGIEGTAAAGHNAGDAVTHVLTSAGLLAYIQDNSVQKPSGAVSGEAAIYDGSTWARSSVTRLTESGIAPGTNGQYLQTSGGTAVWGSPPVIAPTHLPGAFFGNSSGVLVANTAYLVPITNVVIATTLSRLMFGVVTASGNMDLGIYYSDDEITFTRLFANGSFAVPAAGVNSKAITGQVLTPVAGRRWYYAIAADNGTASFVRAAQSGSGAPQVPWGTFSKATSFPLPSSLTTVTANVDPCPVIHGLI